MWREVSILVSKLLENKLRVAGDLLLSRPDGEFGD